MKSVKAATLGILSALLILTLSINFAYGITGTFQPDSTPYVGLVVLFSDPARQVPIGYCTGFLISPTVMLTAGHSCIGVAAVSVWFDKGPITYSYENGQIVYSTNEPVYNGAPVAYPEYVLSLINTENKGKQAFSSSDIGIILLDQPVNGVTEFPALPNAGFIDSLPVKTALGAIGYGVQFQVTPKNNGVLNSWVGTLSCNFAQVNLVSGNFEGSDKYLQCSANPGQDKGGIAFGDSGGPIIYNTNNDQTIVIAVNAYVNNANCAGVTYHTRIDNTLILDWISGYTA